MAGEGIPAVRDFRAPPSQGAGAFCMMRLERLSPCKVNLLLNILSRRPDGFHELETVFQPVAICDTLTVETSPSAGITLTCSQPALPVDGSNLVYRAAACFLEALSEPAAGVRIHLEKQVPLAAGLGGGSSNAATTLLMLNELFGRPLPQNRLQQLAAGLGSDVPFFLQSRPAVATGRGEIVAPLEPFPVLAGAGLFLVHPGFGVSTAWAYQSLARFPEARAGRAGRARELIHALQRGRLDEAGAQLYNSLEAPVLDKYPILALYQDFFRRHGAAGSLMSGSGSTTFALFSDADQARAAIEPFQRRFGETAWARVVPISAEIAS